MLVRIMIMNVITDINVIMILMIMLPIEVTLLGIVTDFSDVHEKKAELPRNRIRVSIKIKN